jgi:hypothetical protein
VPRIRIFFIAVHGYLLSQQRSAFICLTKDIIYR